MDGKEFSLPKAGIGNNKYVAVFDPYSDVNMNRAAAKDLYKKIVDKIVYIFQLVSEGGTATPKNL